MTLNYKTWRFTPPKVSRPYRKANFSSNTKCTCMFTILAPLSTSFRDRGKFRSSSVSMTRLRNGIDDCKGSELGGETWISLTRGSRVCRVHSRVSMFGTHRFFRHNARRVTKTATRRQHKRYLCQHKGPLNLP